MWRWFWFSGILIVAIAICHVAWLGCLDENGYASDRWTMAMSPKSNSVGAQIFNSIKHYTAVMYNSNNWFKLRPPSFLAKECPAPAAHGFGRSRFSSIVSQCQSSIWSGSMLLPECRIRVGICI